MADESIKTTDPVSLATWARIRAAGKAPIGAKPYADEVAKPKKKKSKRK